jgi:NAD(P)-dependent dehydrogenase (short-subunit alcohol dehydrogenase family)
VDRYPLEEWDGVMDVNLDGVFYIVRAAAVAMDDDLTDTSALR